METPTEWSVESRRKSPSPVRIDESGRAVSSVAAHRFFPASGGSRPPSQGTPSPERTPSSSPVRAAPKERTDSPEQTYLANTRSGRLLPPGIAEFVAYPQQAEHAANAAVQMHMESATVSMSAMSMTSPPRARTSPGHKRYVDPLPTEASTSSAGTLPPQDSITSTVGSVGGYYPRAISSKQSPSRAPPSRGSPLKGAAASEFSPGLGFGDRAPLTRAATAQAAPKTMSAADYTKPQDVPRRTTTAGGQREIKWGSRSTGSLPLTNTAARNPVVKSASVSPTKQPKRRQDVIDKTARAELAAANSEGHLPELLPAFRPGKIHKGPKAPTWLVAV